MSAGLALLLHSGRRARTVVLVIAGLLAAFQVLFAFAAESLDQLNSFERLVDLIPDVFRQLLGPSLITILSFRGIVCLGYFHVAVLAVLVGLVISIATEPAAEIESRFLDLVLSHPLARHWVITRSAILLAGAIAIAVGAMAAGTRAGLFWVAAEETARNTFRVVPLLAVNLALLLLCWGAIGLVFASVVQRRSVATAVTALLAMICYLADLIAQVWQPMKRVAPLSPFHYYRTLNLITESGDAARDLQVLACIAAIGFIFAYLLFVRRDL